MLNNHVVFTGFISERDKRALLRSSTIFAIASPAELQCISALEVMACGLPIVVADQVALPELLDSGNNGASFSHPNTEDFAHRTALLLNDPKGLVAKGGHAAKWVRDYYSYHQTIEKYRELYRWAIGLRPYHSETTDE